MTRKAGAIVIEALRRRIRLGRYFGVWAPGDRLPSVRDVAALEGVDRKTAAAAYRELEAEGLVRVEARSGVYLHEPAPARGNPLTRLHAQWLDSALASAEDLGLDADAVRRMFEAVQAVQRLRIPVVDPDLDHARLLATELSARTGLDCVAARPGDLSDGSAVDAPFLVATPAGAEALGSAARRVATVLVSLAPTLLDEVLEAAREGAAIQVVVASEALERDLREVLDGTGDGIGRKVAIRRAGSSADGGEGGTDGRRVLHWPGANGRSGAEGQDGPSRLISDATLAGIRSRIGDAALAQVSTSSDGATRMRPDGSGPRR